MAVAAKGLASVASKAYPAVPGGLSTTWVTGKKYQLKSIQGDLTPVQKKMKLFSYRQQEYCKVGLLHDDRIAVDEFQIARQAKARMTQEQLNGMNYRLNRAILMSAIKRNLPEDEWTPIDAEHNYLDDIYEQLQAEIFEKKLTKAALNDYDSNWERMGMIPFRIVHYLKIKQARKEMAYRFSQPVV